MIIQHHNNEAVFMLTVIYIKSYLAVIHFHFLSYNSDFFSQNCEFKIVVG